MEQLRHFLIVGMLVAATSTAAAQPSDSEPAQRRTVRYAHELLLTDAASLAAGRLTGSFELFSAGFVLAPPMVHLRRGQAGRAAGSLAVRAGLPLVGLWMGARLTDAHCAQSSVSACGVDEMIAGLAAGAVVAALVDYTLLARASTTVEGRPEKPARRRGRFQWAPRLAVGAGGNLRVGVNGRW